MARDHIIFVQRDIFLNDVFFFAIRFKYPPDYFLAHVRRQLEIGGEKGPRELAQNPQEGNGRATLRLA